MSLADKLCPDRFSEMSGKMAAILGYILDEAWTEPAIVALSVTSDGFVTTDAEFLGEAADLDRNLLNLLVAAGLTNDERADFERRYRALDKPRVSGGRDDGIRPCSAVGRVRCRGDAERAGVAAIRRDGADDECRRV